MTFLPLRDDFVEQVAPARTFAFESEVPQILRSGLGAGGSLENALILGTTGALNREGLRFPDEPVRHKLLDAMGDLFLLGGLPWATITLIKPGHSLMGLLARQTAPLCSPIGAGTVEGRRAI